MHLPKLNLASVPFDVGRKWRGDGAHLFQEKADGVWMPEPLEFQGHWLVAERMKRESSHSADATAPPGFNSSKNGDHFVGGNRESPVSRFQIPPAIHYVVHNIVGISGEDVRGRPLRERWPELVRIAREFPPHVRLCRTGSGGEFLEAIVAAGGEGVCVHSLDAPYGAQAWKCKRSQVFYCAVTELDGWRGAAKLKLMEDGGLRMEDRPNTNAGLQSSILYPPSTNPRTARTIHPPGFNGSKNDAGWIALRSRFERVRVGSVLKVEAYGLTRAGKLREARLDKDAPDSWLVKY